MAVKQKNIGSDFDDFLAEEGILNEVETAALKKVIAFQIQREMEKKNISKTDMAAMMKTSRASLSRLLDPRNDSVTLKTLGCAASALGKRLKIELL